MTNQERRKTVYHECGHALIATLSGGEIELLTIEADEDSPLTRYGEIRVAWPEDRFSGKDIAREEVRVALAGPIAEIVCENEQLRPQFLEEWRADWDLAVERAQSYLPPRRSVSEHLGRVAFELMTFLERDDVWAALAALADELDAHETLEPDDIAAVIEGWPIE